MDNRLKTRRINIRTTTLALVAQWITRQPPKLKIVGSIPTLSKIRNVMFFILLFTWKYKFKYLLCEEICNHFMEICNHFMGFK